MAPPPPKTLGIFSPLPLNFDDNDSDDDDDGGKTDREEKVAIDTNMTITVYEEYQPRTLGEHNIERLSILPIYPPYSPSTPTTTIPRKPHLLLSNVPSKDDFTKHNTFFFFF